MNIISNNKEAFSDENKLPRKAARRRPPMRPGTRPLRDAAKDTAPHDIAKPVFGVAPEQPRTESEASGSTVSAELQPDLSAPAQPNKTTFYQAARPKQPFTPRPHMGMPPRGDRPVTPAVRPPQPGTPRLDRSRPNMTGQAYLPGQQPMVASTYIDRNPNNPKLRIIPLGGLEEIGKNMTILEYGDDIIVIDMGFLFPDSDMLGVDYIIPDISYLDDKKHKIRGAVITHGHLDHIGAIPYLVERLGFPTMYGTPITIGMVKHRLEEFNLVSRNKTVTIEPNQDSIQLGAFRVKPFHLAHSVPGAIGLEIETPNGRLVYATDWKFDYTPADGKPVDFRDLAAVGSRGVDLLFSDSTNAEKPGFCMSERVIGESISNLIEEAPGRVIIAMFSSNLNRIQQTIDAASKNNRKVMIVGRSMQNNVEMAVNLKAIQFPPNVVINDRDAVRIPEEKMVIICTGAQGEERSALIRMASGEHRSVKIKPGDTVVISASPIPGNEKSVGFLMDTLYKAGANVIYNATQDVHTTGHAYQEELKLMVALMHPKYFVPLHGERNKRITHGKLASQVGVERENIMLGDNGSVIEMDHTGRVYLTDEVVPAGYVIVDGLGVGDVGSIVLADRKAMAQEGIFVVITVYDAKQKKFITSPDIISRGFIYMRENEKFVNDVRQEIKRFLQNGIEQPNFDFSTIKNDLRDYLSKMLYQKTERQPMVIPVIIEV